MITLGLSQKLPTRCDDCGHCRTQHVKGLGCMTCYSVTMSRAFSSMIRKVCTRSFTFNMSASDREQAIRAPKGAYNGEDVCAVCDEIWWAHQGFLCPNGETTFVLKK